jgi:hypothetical protein
METKGASMTMQIETTSIEDFRRGVPGIYPGIPASEYHRHGAISASVLKRAYTHSPKHAKAVMDNPDLIAGESIDIGGGSHCLTLTPSDFDSEYICAEQCSATVKASGLRCANSGIKCVNGEWVCGVHGKGMSCDYSGKVVLTTDEYRRVKGVHDAVWAHDGARQILQNATDTELSILWKDNETGLLNKARLDILCREIGVLPDLKTTRSLKDFQRDAYKMAYHIQLAHYFRGAMVAGIAADVPSVVAVENDEPFDVTVFEPTARFMDFGRRDMEATLRTIQTCHRTGIWPGFAKGTQPLDVPDWAK